MAGALATSHWFGGAAGGRRREEPRPGLAVAELSAAAADQFSPGPVPVQSWSGPVRSMEPSRAALLELSGVLVAAGGSLGSLAATLMSGWLTLSSELLPAETFQLGLWGACVVQEGALECRPYPGVLGLPPDIQLARALMCLTLAAGLLGLLLAVPGMALVNSCGQHPDPRRCKRVLRAAGGALSLVAGALQLAPVSQLARRVAHSYFDPSLPEVAPRWEFGDALFCGWTAGALHLLGGALLITSCVRERTQDGGGEAVAASIPLSRRRRCEYV